MAHGKAGAGTDLQFETCWHCDCETSGYQCPRTRRERERCVSGDGCLVGLVTQRDVLAAADSNILPDQPAHEAEERYIALSTIMTSPVQTVDESARLRGTALHMQQNKLGCLPVVRDDRLVGIITDSDFVSIAVNLMEQLEAAEPDLDDFDPADDLDF